MKTLQQIASRALQSLAADISQGADLRPLSDKIERRFHLIGLTDYIVSAIHVERSNYRLAVAQLTANAKPWLMEYEPFRESLHENKT